MWKTGDRLIYKTLGVCTFEGIKSESFMGEMCEYYQLRPLGDEKNVTLVPKNNQALVARMFPLVSTEEAGRIISLFDTFEHPWKDNDKLRAEDFKSTLESCDRERIAGLINTVRKKRREAFEKGKKTRASDESFCERAEKLLFSELSYVLGCEIPDICAKIFTA